jgi:hypothetical protein
MDIRGLPWVAWNFSFDFVGCRMALVRLNSDE